MTTIRDRIAKLTAGVDTQVGLDRVAQTTLATLVSEYPGTDAGEILYYWEERKLSISRMTDDD